MSVSVQLISGSELLHERYDIQATVIYAGRAERGTAASASAWIIKRILLDGSGNPTASAWAGPNVIWDNRAGLTYS